MGILFSCSSNRSSRVKYLRHPSFSPDPRSLDPGKHRGLDPELSGWYAHWLLDDLQAVTAGWYSSPLYPGWDSTNHYLDTGELTGLVTARTPSDAVVELEALSLSQACGGGGGGGLLGEDESGEGGRGQMWGTVDGLTPSAR